MIGAALLVPYIHHHLNEGIRCRVEELLGKHYCRPESQNPFGRVDEGRRHLAPRGIDCRSGRGGPLRGAVDLRRMFPFLPDRSFRPDERRAATDASSTPPADAAHDPPQRRLLERRTAAAAAAACGQHRSPRSASKTARSRSSTPPSRLPAPSRFRDVNLTFSPPFHRAAVRKEAAAPPPHSGIGHRRLFSPVRLRRRDRSSTGPGEPGGQDRRHG